jgi:hypothetical protein
MRKGRFAEEQMVTILREADQRSVPEVARNSPGSASSAATVTHEQHHFTMRPDGAGGGEAPPDPNS